MSRATNIVNLETADGLVDKRLGPSGPFEITAAKIVDFANATDDFQGIHVDKTVAQAAGFEDTIAHGYLVLSLLSQFAYQLIEFSSKGPIINYGLDRVRFLKPVLAGAKLVAFATIKEIKPKNDMFIITTEYELQDQDARTVLVATSLIAVALDDS
jgi:acyl dehydratase